MKTSYDPSTDSLYIELRPFSAARTRRLSEDVMLDIGEDGEPTGYDIQFARSKSELIGRIILGERIAVAAE